MRMGQGVRTGLGHGGITCVLQTQFSSLFMCLNIGTPKIINFPFVPNGKLIIFRCPKFWHITAKL